MILRLFRGLKNDGTDKRKNDPWRVLLFALVDTAGAGVAWMMGKWIYYTQNVLQLGLFLALVITPMVILDMITDPILANYFDRFESKFGKFKPIMAVGTLLIVVPGIVIFTYPVETALPSWLDFTILIAMYIVLIFGFTTLSTAAKAGQAIITQDPKQRPLYSMAKTIFEGGVMIGATQILYGDFFGELQDPRVWRITIIIISLISIFSVSAAMIAISNRDKPIYYNVGKTKKKKVKFIEYFTVIKRNGPLKRLLIASVSDTFAATIRSGFSIYLFANIIQQRQIYNEFDFISSLFVGLPILFIGIFIATRKGTAKTYTGVAYIQTILGVLGFIAVLIFIPAGPEYMYSGLSIGIFSILIIWSLYLSSNGITNGLLSAMAGDLTDYEYVQTGKFIPATIGGVIGTVRKLSTTVKGIIIFAVLAYCGFGGVGESSVITENVFINYRFYYSVIIVVFLLPALGHFITVLAMRKYPLNEEKMQEISKIMLRDRGLSEDEDLKDEAVESDTKKTKRK